jgi:DNA-binding GntR family transcriptional regulator
MSGVTRRPILDRQICETSMYRARSNEDHRPIEAAAIDAVSPARTFAEQAYAQLKDALIAGRFTPGQHVTLRSLCARLGTSVTPVREALLRLASAFALEYYGYRDVRIPVLSSADLDELQHLRLTLESLALRASQRSRRQVAEARRLHDRLSVGIDTINAVDFAVTASALRRNLLGLAEYPVLAPLIDRIWCRFGPAFTQVLADPTFRRELVTVQADLIAAIELRDLAAALQALEQEIHLSRRALRQPLAGRESGMRH